MARKKETCRRRLRADGGARVGAVLLAAGQSTRFERGNKLLAPVDERPLVRHAAATLLDATVEDVVVVTGYQAGAVREALSGLEVSVRENPDYAAGQSTSVQTGIETARARDWDGTVFALGDMPYVESASVDTLVERYQDSGASIVAPTYDGQRGNPVLFDASWYETLASVTGDEGGRQIVEQEGDLALVETNDPGVIVDIDTRSDLSEHDR